MNTSGPQADSARLPSPGDPSASGARRLSKARRTIVGAAWALAWTLAWAGALLMFATRTHAGSAASCAHRSAAAAVEEPAAPRACARLGFRVSP